MARGKVLVPRGAIRTQILEVPEDGIRIDGVVLDASAAELDLLDGVAAGTMTAGKVLVPTTGGLVDTLDITTPKIGGTAVTATSAEINKLAGVTGGTVTASKALVVGSSSQLDALTVTTLTPTKEVFTAATTLTIASGAVAATQTVHLVDGEGAAADTLTDITGGVAGQMLILRSVSAARVITITHAIGANKIQTPGGRPILLAAVTDVVVLESNGTQWTAVGGSQLVEAPRFLTIPIQLASIVDGDVVTNIPLTGSGRITSIDAFVSTVATTGSKASTLNLEINSTNLTGGAVALTSANCTPLGAKIAGSAVTAANTFVTGDTLSVEASSTTAFAEGAIFLVITIE